jgi:adenylate cyclase
MHVLHNQPEAAIEACPQALRLSPFDPQDFAFAGGISPAHTVARRFDAAIQWGDRALRTHPRYINVIRARAVAYAHLGRIEEARVELSRMVEIYPELTIARFRSLLPRSASPEFIEVFCTGLRPAGLPEE